MGCALRETRGNQHPCHFTKRERALVSLAMKQTRPDPRKQFWRKLVIDLAVMVAIGVVLALIGPFGSFEASFSTRLAYWVGLGLAGYACYRPMGWAVERVGGHLDLPVWLMWVFACLIATAPMTVLVAAIDRLPRLQLRHRSGERHLWRDPQAERLRDFVVR